MPDKRKAMSIDRFLEYEGITAENIDKYIEREGHSWHGVGCSEFVFGCSPKGVELGMSNEEGYAFWNWKQVKKYVEQPKQITFEGWN